ncbi:hypothetical protein [Lactobacillus sp. Sy-1]|uniref:hypothetical protein n=1 Tax=Lactobacillus sp. Sy-1 TaxID=2109645 RepID=UPI001C5B5C43|nr:hypothetical protein [Lactobacillus sp. Sy-1]MBW1606450.1 hypothetical protein [Lactobacillus sp. Sy-1]
MTTKFIKLPYEFITDPELATNGAVAISLLLDLRGLSVKNRDFYDSKQGEYFVIFPLERMAQLLKVTTRTVGKIYKKLESLNYITRVKQFNAPDKIFLTSRANVFSADVEENISCPQEKKVPSNHSYSNQTYKSTSNTVNTDNLKYNKIDKWKNSVSGSLHLHSMVIDKILDYTRNNVKRAYKIVGIILNAKKNIATKHDILNQPETRFENNANLGTKLAIKLQHVFSFLPKQTDEADKYLMTSLKTFFLDAFGIVKDEIVKPQAESKQPVKEMFTPDWLKPGYVATKDDEITEEERLKTEAMIRSFGNRTI